MEEKSHPAAEDVASEQLLALDAKFTLFTQQVLEKLDSILELKQIVSQLCEGKKAQRQAEAAKKREQRAHLRCCGPKARRSQSARAAARL